MTLYILAFTRHEITPCACPLKCSGYMPGHRPLYTMYHHWQVSLWSWSNMSTNSSNSVLMSQAKPCGTHTTVGSIRPIAWPNTQTSFYHLYLCSLTFCPIFLWALDWSALNLNLSEEWPVCRIGWGEVWEPWLAFGSLLVVATWKKIRSENTGKKMHWLQYIFFPFLELWKSHWIYIRVTDVKGLFLFLHWGTHSFSSSLQLCCMATNTMCSSWALSRRHSIFLCWVIVRSDYRLTDL